MLQILKIQSNFQVEQLAFAEVKLNMGHEISCKTNNLNH